MDEILALKKIINGSEKIVFFGGAGVSTESGIPDFRSVDGLYNQKYDYPPETILSHTFFMQNTDEFYRFYYEKMLVLDKLPNPAHKALKTLEDSGKLLAIVTQNIDGLHQKAGSKKVYELHGSIHRNFCLKCGKFYSGEELKNLNGGYKCSCGGIIKPDVVLYEEPLNNDVINGAVQSIARADTLIVAGTSLSVYPAASFIDFFKGKNLVVINLTEPVKKVTGALYVKGKVGEVLSKII